MNDVEVRVALGDLEKEFDREEDRFTELRKTIGSIQSSGIYPSIIGFSRSLSHTLLKLTMPLLFASILVLIDTIWIAVWSLILLFLGYFGVQFFILRACISGKEILNGALFIFVGYVSIFLFLEVDYAERNYFGWGYILIVVVSIGFTGVA
jgi:hypothetical protein